MLKICGHCGQPYDVNCDCIANEVVAKFIYDKMQRGTRESNKKDDRAATQIVHGTN